MSCRRSKPTKWPVCTTKTQISLGIICPRFLHADSEDWSDFAGWTGHFVGFVMLQLISNLFFFLGFCPPVPDMGEFLHPSCLPSCVRLFLSPNRKCTRRNIWRPRESLARLWLELCVRKKKQPDKVVRLEAASNTRHKTDITCLNWNKQISLSKYGFGKWTPYIIWFKFLLVHFGDKCLIHVWATTWQNQQNECVPSEDSDQPGHPPSLMRVIAVRSMGS